MIEKIKLVLDIFASLTIIAMCIFAIVNFFAFRKSTVNQTNDNIERVEKLEKRLDRLEKDCKMNFTIFRD